MVKGVRNCARKRKNMMIQVTAVGKQNIFYQDAASVCPYKIYQ
jgi:hypothetical protein